MTPESIRMSNLIMKAEGKCQSNGHDMDWLRYDNEIAWAKCRKCGSLADIDLFFPGDMITAGPALTTNCTKKGR